MNWKKLTAALIPTAIAARWLARRRQVLRLRRTWRRRLEQRLRYAEGQIQGLRYRLEGRRPDPNVGDDVLVDRVRSTLGPVAKRLDLPHVHVMVHDRVALLHGDVPGREEEQAIVDTILGVAGVEGVISYLHEGLLPSDTRPSEGRARVPPSTALRRLLAGAEGAGAENPRRAVRAILATFVNRIPPGERGHLLTHLPDDVRRLARTPTHTGRALHDENDLVAAVAASGAFIETPDPRGVVEAVIGVLRDLVPEETADITAVLPDDLKHVWVEAPAPV